MDSPQKQANIPRTTSTFPYEQRDTCVYEFQCMDEKYCDHDDYDQPYSGHRDIKTDRPIRASKRSISQSDAPRSEWNQGRMTVQQFFAQQKNTWASLGEPYSLVNSKSRQEALDVEQLHNPLYNCANLPIQLRRSVPDLRHATPVKHFPSPNPLPNSNEKRNPEKIMYADLCFLVDDVRTGKIIFDSMALKGMFKYRWAFHAFPILRGGFQAQQNLKPLPHPIAQLMQPSELFRLNFNRPLPFGSNNRPIITFDLAARLVKELLDRYVSPITKAEDREREDFLMARARRQSFVRVAKQGVDIEQFVKQNGCLPF